MRKILYIIISMPILLLSACDVHEWPETPEFVKLHLRLNYETDMTEWEHLYDGASVIEQGLGETTIRIMVRYAISSALILYRRNSVPHRTIHRNSYLRRIYQRVTTTK